MHGRSKHAPKHMSLANESKPDRKAVIVLTCCALQSACYSPTGIVISFILAQFQGEVQTNLTVKRFLMCSAALCTSIAEELFIISRLSRSAERSKRIFTGGVVTASGSCSAAFYESAALRNTIFSREKWDSGTPAGVPLSRKYKINFPLKMPKAHAAGIPNRPTKGNIIA